MIDAGTSFSGFDARSWHRLVSLFVPGLASQPPERWARRAATRGGVLLVFHDGVRVLRAVHTLRGPLAADAWQGPETLRALAARTHTRFAVALRTGALESFFERVGGRITAHDDPFVTASLVLGVARELLEDGAAYVLPEVPRGVPLPPVDVALRAWDALLPDGRTAALVLFEGEHLDTALLARRRGLCLDRLHGPEVLHRLVGPLGGDFRRDYRVIRAAIERDLGPMSVGVFAQTDTFRALLRRDDAGAWARAVAARDVVVDPMPPWFAVAAGAGAMRAAARRSSDLFAGVEFPGPARPDPVAPRPPRAGRARGRGRPSRPSSASTRCASCRPCCARARPCPTTRRPTTSPTTSPPTTTTTWCSAALVGACVCAPHCSPPPLLARLPVRPWRLPRGAACDSVGGRRPEAPALGQRRPRAP